jgi:hypothetical protein
VETFGLVGPSGMDPVLGPESPKRTGYGEGWVGLACVDGGSSPESKQYWLKTGFLILNGVYAGSVY